VELSENIYLDQLTNLIAASLLIALWQMVIVKLLLQGNGSQYTILNFSLLEESCFHQSRSDIV
jgi:hypothetical protein